MEKYILTKTQKGKKYLYEGGYVAAKVAPPKREKKANPDITQNGLQ